MTKKKKIDKNVSISESTQSKHPFLEMEIGDSFFVPLIEWIDFSMQNGGLHRLANFYAPGRQFTHRRTDKPVEGFRVWRIPFPDPGSDESSIFWEKNAKMLKGEII